MDYSRFHHDTQYSSVAAGHTTSPHIYTKHAINDIPANVSASSRSFGSMINSPYRIPYIRNVQHERSIESPYTSLGSAQSSYASISNVGSYGLLKARAEKATELHESKSRAVMEALQSLQSKIRCLETDRTNAEDNLKSLATETKDYKQLLQQKHVFENSNSSTDSHSKDLEQQLDHAQDKCELLEKQLEYMRLMMQNNQAPSSSPSSKPTATLSSPRTHSPSNITLPSPCSITTSAQLVNSPSVLANRQPIAMPTDSPAMEKLNDLEKEHQKLTASQNMTEGKIRELEEKISEERHQRKMLQSKAAELQLAFTANRLQRFNGESDTQEYSSKKVKRRNKTSRSSSVKLKPSPRQPAYQVHSPSHYHLDLAAIPFVVGQSTARSHSLGANIQNVLSIMKSHNNLCNDEISKPSAVFHKQKKLKSVSDDDMKDLLVTLQDEFGQLGFEHREMSSQLQQIDDEKIRNDTEKELERLVDKMETKGNQIQTIRDHIKTLKEKKKSSKKKMPNHNTVRMNSGSNQVEIVTTVKTKECPNAKPNLDMLKKVRKLQSTLRKDDLKWE